MDDFETPKGMYTMSASALEETRERLAQCFCYIRDVAGGGGTGNSVALDSALILTSPAASAPPDLAADARVPEWLVAALVLVPGGYQHEKFEAVMTADGATFNPPIVISKKVPMIRCINCPEEFNLHPPGPGNTVDDFLAHLERKHLRWPW